MHLHVCVYIYIKVYESRAIYAKAGHRKPDIGTTRARALILMVTPKGCSAQARGPSLRMPFAGLQAGPSVGGGVLWFGHARMQRVGAAPVVPPRKHDHGPERRWARPFHGCCCGWFL